MALSKTQVDRLGERLRKAEMVTTEDTALFEEYRVEHLPVLDAVLAVAGDVANYRVKTLESTVAKLNRQPARLSQIGDIAGCRIVLAGLRQQESELVRLLRIFHGCRVRDYREATQYGYRALHVEVHASDGHRVEIQLRTTLQNEWANVSETTARSVDIDLKYGGGPAELRSQLGDLSALVAALDTSLADRVDLESRVAAARATVMHREAVSGPLPWSAPVQSLFEHHGDAKLSVRTALLEMVQRIDTLEAQVMR